MFFKCILYSEYERDGSLNYVLQNGGLFCVFDVFEELKIYII